MNEKIPVVNIYRVPMALGDVFIGRHKDPLLGQFGNPFHIGTDGDRDTVIQKFRDYLAIHPRLVDALITKKPKRLLCYCAPEPCHGDVYAEALAERGYRAPED